MFVLGLSFDESSKFRLCGLLAIARVAVYIDASTVVPTSSSYILHPYQRDNQTPSPAKSRLDLHPGHRHQLVYANHSILRISLQFLKFIQQNVLPSPKIRPGMASRSQQRYVFSIYSAESSRWY